MKRYENNGNSAVMVSSTMGNWCKWIDHIAERAKDKEEIESLKRKNELLIQTIEHSKEEIARLKEEINLVCSKLPHCWCYYLNENREEEGRERE